MENFMSITPNGQRDNNHHLMSTMDAAEWAQEFMATMKRMKWKKKDINEDLMLSWFAAAIMTGYDEASRRYRKNGD